MLVRSELTERVIGLAIDVHRQLGLGLLETIYEECLCFELEFYRDRRLKAGFRADILVDDDPILEVKSIESIHPVHEAQLLTYLRLKDGLRRFVM